MPSNPIGPGTKNLTVNIPSALHLKLNELARKSGKKLGAYVRKVLEDTVEQDVVYREIRESRSIAFDDGALHVAEDPPKQRKRTLKSR
jgi:hypothetical protein